MKQTWPAPERNKQPLLEVLARVLPPRGRVLELACGSGQHALHFASHLVHLHFMPSDVDSQNLESARAWAEEASLPNLEPPRRIDVCDADWGVGQVEAVFNANMVHITPWACTEGLVRGVGRHLSPGGVCVLYGPFRWAGAHTAESNAAFDASLRQRNPTWGVRDAEAIEALAAAQGLTLTERIAMPANNQILVFHRET